MIKTTTYVRRWVSNWSVSLLCRTHLVFLRRKCIEKSCRKLISCKPENGIPWLFTDFANNKDFHWLFKKFLDYSLTLKIFRTSLTVATLYSVEKAKIENKSIYPPGRGDNSILKGSVSIIINVNYGLSNATCKPPIQDTTTQKAVNWV